MSIRNGGNFQSYFSFIRWKSETLTDFNYLPTLSSLLAFFSLPAAAFGSSICTPSICSCIRYISYLLQRWSSFLVLFFPVALFLIHGASYLHSAFSWAVLPLSCWTHTLQTQLPLPALQFCQKNFCSLYKLSAFLPYSFLNFNPAAMRRIFWIGFNFLCSVASVYLFTSNVNTTDCLRIIIVNQIGLLTLFERICCQYAS